ncbi:phage head-tail connector protein [Bacillus litorisediminis]|uniref:phage head-tail connector protein n=1 Tax=Bacillus litorisediminis TaxID=2922713 RepID=UPI001FAE8DDB|nr:phage head-tail connector protein [Bacillus litorisediminis]
MDEMQRNESANNILKLLGLPTDQNNLDIINLYLSRAINFVLNYCGITEIPTQLIEVVEDIVIIKYRLKGVEGQKSEEKGSLVETFIDSLPLDIINQLNRYRMPLKVKVI